MPPWLQEALPAISFVLVVCLIVALKARPVSRLQTFSHIRGSGVISHDPRVQWRLTKQTGRHVPIVIDRGEACMSVLYRAFCCRTSLVFTEWDGHGQVIYRPAHFGAGQMAANPAVGDVLFLLTIEAPAGPQLVFSFSWPSDVQTDRIVDAVRVAIADRLRAAERYVETGITPVVALPSRVNLRPAIVDPVSDEDLLRYHEAAARLITA